jgi:manganese efflux pump family protein
LVGLAMGQAIVLCLSPWSDWLGALLLALYGGYMLMVGRRPEHHDENPAWLLGLPVVLSLDNLAAGVGLGALGFPILWSAVVLGLASGLLALVGLTIGAAAARSLPFRAELVAGAGNDRPWAL